MARYEVSLVYSKPDLYFASVFAMMYVVSCYTGLRYNGTWRHHLIIFKEFELFKTTNSFKTEPIYPRQCSKDSRNPCTPQLWCKCRSLVRSIKLCGAPLAFPRRGTSSQRHASMYTPCKHTTGISIEYLMREWCHDMFINKSWYILDIFQFQSGIIHIYVCVNIYAYIFFQILNI